MKTDGSDNDDYEINGDIIVMTIDGVQSKDIAELPNHEQYSHCDICDKYYTEELMHDNDGFITCYHCWFCLKYEDFAKNEVTESDTVSLMNYIETNYKKHNCEKCKNKSDSGGCFLCEYNEGIVPDCILKITLNKNKTSAVAKTSENDNLCGENENSIKFNNDIPTKYDICAFKSNGKFVLTI